LGQDSGKSAFGKIKNCLKDLITNIIIVPYTENLKDKEREKRYYLQNKEKIFKYSR
jgi:hypothetical protein